MSSYSTEKSETSNNVNIVDTIFIKDSGSSNEIAISVPDTLSASKIWTLPLNDGDNGQALSTNGSGQLGFTSISTGFTSVVNGGTGQGVFAQLNSTTAEFKGLTSVNSTVSLQLIPTSTVVTLYADEARLSMNKLTTAGDLLYHNGTDYARLPLGTVGQILTTNGAGSNPSWQTSPTLYPNILEEFISIDLASTTSSTAQNLDFIGTFISNKTAGSDWVINTTTSGDHYIQWTGTSMDNLLMVVEIHVKDVSIGVVSTTNETLDFEFDTSSAFGAPTSMFQIVYRIPSTSELMPLTMLTGKSLASNQIYFRIRKNGTGRSITFTGGYLTISLYRKGVV